VVGIFCPTIPPLLTGLVALLERCWLALRLEVLPMAQPDLTITAFFEDVYIPRRLVSASAGTIQQYEIAINCFALLGQEPLLSDEAIQAVCEAIRTGWDRQEKQKRRRLSIPPPVELAEMPVEGIEVEELVPDPGFRDLGCCCADCRTGAARNQKRHRQRNKKPLSRLFA